METLVRIVGMIVIVTACAGCIWAFFTAGCYSFERMLRSHRNAVWHETRESIVQRLVCDSWWFSEDPKTMRALQLYAEMLVSGFGGVSSVREKWRSEFAVPESSKPETEGEHG